MAPAYTSDDEESGFDEQTDYAQRAAGYEGEMIYNEVESGQSPVTTRTISPE